MSVFKEYGYMNNWDVSAISGDAKYRVIDADGAIQSILIESEPYLGKATEVFAYIGVPQVKNQTVPGMVCVHGGGGEAFKQWVEMWVARGYAAIAMDLSGRDGDGNRLLNGGPEQNHEAKFSTRLSWQDMWTYHAVAAVIRSRSILADLPSVDSARIGITGISWGGYVTCIAAGVDKGFACAIPIYGCGFLQHGSADDWMKIFADMTNAQRQSWHDHCDPSVYLGNVRAPMLFVSGTNDFAYPVNILEMSCALPVGDVTRCVRVGMGHGHESGWAPKEIGIFADQHLMNGTPLAKIGACEVAEHSLKAAFTASLAISHGYLLYTKCSGRWQDRKWHAAPAAIGNGVVEAELPEDVSACYLAIEDERGAYVSSPCATLPSND